MTDPAGPVARLRRYRDLRAHVAALLDDPTVRLALARHDLTTVYRILNNAGIPQRRIAEMVGQRQSEISEILAGRRVQRYSVLLRIADGLDVPRSRMGLAFDADTEALLASTQLDESAPDSGY